MFDIPKPIEVPEGMEQGRIKVQWVPCEEPQTYTLADYWPRHYSWLDILRIRIKQIARNLFKR